MDTVVGAYRVGWAGSQSGLCSQAVDIVQVDGSSALSKEGIGSCNST